MDRQTNRLFLNGAFALALYLAVGERIDAMALPVIGFAWTLFALNVATLATGNAGHAAGAAGSHSLWMVFDIAVLAALFLPGWYWTAFAYAGSCGCVQLIHARTASRS